MVGYKNKMYISNTDMKIASNKDVSKDHGKLHVTPLKPGRAEDAVPKIVKNLDRLIKQTDN